MVSWLVQWIYRRIRVTQWANVDDLGTTPKDSPGTVALAIFILEEVASLLLCEGIPRGIDFTGNFEDIALTTDFTCIRFH